MERVARDLAHPWDVAALAAIAGLSPSRFANRFRACLGEPPRRWLERMRHERARRLLRDGDLPIHVVAEQVGYPDPLHFAVRYRARWGHAPSHERRARLK